MNSERFQDNNISIIYFIFFFREKQEAIPDLGIVWACVRLIEQQNNTFVWDWRNIYITHRQCEICMYPRGRDSPDKYINIFND